MNSDFHYYATYCAAAIAGFPHEACQEICYSAQLVDHCTKTFLKTINGPLSAATTQLQSEMVNARTDLLGLQDITRIWSSFHFLPRDLYAEVKRGSKKYKDKYRLICGPNGNLVVDTVNLAKDHGNEAIGLAMHVLADTWAHTYFAGTPSLVINNTDSHFFELIPQEDGSFVRRPIEFGHNPAAKEDPKKGAYTGSLYQASENNIMNLGHGRAGHLPDYSFIRYVYLPAWGNYEEIVKDNPHDYIHAFAQMVYALQYLNGTYPEFEKETYAWEAIEPYREEIERILSVRRVDDSQDWKALGESITGETIRDFKIDEYQKEYTSTPKDKKDEETFLGRFFIAAMTHKSMVTSRISASGSRLAGISIDYISRGFHGINDYRKIIKKTEDRDNI
ncbi:MAG: hypothetical protein IKE28_10470 [Solobacterium sp.]|nr:hypothetical protein [Solobacterium sp.]